MKWNNNINGIVEEDLLMQLPKYLLFLLYCFLLNPHNGYFYKDILTGEKPKDDNDIIETFIPLEESFDCLYSFSMFPLLIF